MFVADEGFDVWQLDARRGVDDTDEVDEAVLDPTGFGQSWGVVVFSGMDPEGFSEPPLFHGSPSVEEAEPL